MMRNTCRVFIIYFAQNPDETNGGTQDCLTLPGYCQLFNQWIECHNIKIIKIIKKSTTYYY